MKTPALAIMALSCWISSAALATAQTVAPATDDSLTPQALAEFAESLAPSLVRIEYTIRYNRGELPASGDNWETLIKEERPGERGGFLIAPAQVYTSDPMIHPRFIEAIKVRFGEHTVDARAAAYPRDDSGWILDLASPLPGAKPLQFEKDQDGPFLGLTYTREGLWTTRITGIRGGAAISEDGRQISYAAPATLILAKDGKPVGISGSGSLPLDDSWKGSPAAWPALTQSEMDKALERTEQLAANSILRVEINFRSPRSQGEGMGMFGMPMRHHYGPDDPDSATEWSGLGLLTNDRTLLVLANLRPKNTARIERIRAFLPDGREVTARFKGSLRDWGAIIAELEEPQSGSAAFSSIALPELRGKLLLKGEIGISGETRIAHFWRDRFDGLTVGHRGRLYPSAGGGHPYYPRMYNQGGNETSSWLFTDDGSLVTIPLERRERVETEQNRWYGSSALPVPADIVAEILADADSQFDTENRPLSEEEENRLAWLGVELQGMNPELARVNSVVEQTRNGQSGALVTFIYANSPAATAGLKLGDILLRLNVEGHPQPIEVTLQENEFGGMFDQFWSMMDEIPIEYMENMPAPWGSVENVLTRALTDLGFGTPFIAEVFRDGAVLQVPFEVTPGPAHYDAAPRLKSEEAGLTVRDLTYEVRRYFQIPDQEPGIIISRVENGGRASVAGLRPYELILAVNDQPVSTVAAFEKAIADGGEFRMSIKRMTTGRIVKIKIDPASK